MTERELDHNLYANVDSNIDFNSHAKLRALASDTLELS